MKTIDLKKTLKPLYAATASKPVLLDIPAMNCLMVDGKGDPNGVEFQEATGTLYSVAYAMKFSFKKEKGIDYPVTALEGLWSADDPGDFLRQARDRWKWTLLMVLPDAVTKKDVADTVSEVRKKAKFPRFPVVRFERFAEGKAAQVMHVGPYSSEAETIRRLHDFIAAQGYRPRGRHHEIYLGDPRRSAPEKLKTIIRQPVQPVQRAPAGR